VQVRVWGARGSVPTPGEERIRYGGNTSCVQVTLADSTLLVLDAGTGIRELGEELRHSDAPIHILLTHLHLDHIQGLLFFAPLFDPRREVTIWGPATAGSSLRDRIGRYLSAPLTPVEVRELPCQLEFRNCPVSEWTIGQAHVRAEAVTHRGPTLGFRVTSNGGSLTYLPDHEPALAGPIAELGDEWLSGFALAKGTDLLIHDAQYSDEEYPQHFGWGHTSLSDALTFARRTGAARTLLFHHDPSHTDEQLDASLAAARASWTAEGGDGAAIAMAAEQTSLEV